MNPFAMLITLQTEIMMQTFKMSAAIATSMMKDQQRLLAGWRPMPMPTGDAKGGACVPFRLR